MNSQLQNLLQNTDYEMLIHIYTCLPGYLTYKKKNIFVINNRLKQILLAKKSIGRIAIKHHTSHLRVSITREHNVTAGGVFNKHRIKHIAQEVSDTSTRYFP